MNKEPGLKQIKLFNQHYTDLPKSNDFCLIGGCFVPLPDTDGEAEMVSLPDGVFAADFGVAGDFVKYLNSVLFGVAGAPPVLLRLDIVPKYCIH